MNLPQLRLEVVGVDLHRASTGAGIMPIALQGVHSALAVAQAWPMWADQLHSHSANTEPQHLQDILCAICM